MPEAEELIKNMQKSLTVRVDEELPFTNRMKPDGDGILHENDNVNALITMGEKAVMPAANALKNDPSPMVRYGAATVLRKMDHEKISQKSRETSVEALLSGLDSKEDWVRYNCLAGLTKEKLINGVGKESKERIVDVLVAKYNSDKSGDDWREKIVLAVGSLDYSNITDGTKKKAFDLLARATWDDDSGTRLRAAELVDRIGDKDTIKKVAEHWFPLLDIPQNGTMEDIYRSNHAVDIFERIRWEPAADKALELMKKRLAVQRVNGVGLGVIARSGSSKHEDAVIEVMTHDRDYNRPGFYAVPWFETLGKIGTEKSVKLLNEYIEKQKQGALSHLSSRELKDEGKVKQVIEREKLSDFTWRAAEAAIKEIERRISLAKPAEEKIKEAMKREKVKV